MTGADPEGTAWARVRWGRVLQAP